VADDIRELNALIADYGREFQSPDPRRGPSLGSSRLYADYQPATSSEQAEMLLSLLPGIGGGLDAANLVQDLENREYGQAGLSGLAMLLPGVGAGTVKQVAKKLKIDNPGGSWLRDKKEEAAEAMAKAYPNTYRKNLGTTAITGYHDGTIDLDPKQLADVPGAMGEELSRTSGQKLANLQKSIEQEGYKPSPIMIHVREDGQPFIVEGNTRVAEAIISNRPSIQAEIKYLRGAEEVEGPLSPDKIFETPKPTTKADKPTRRPDGSYRYKEFDIVKDGKEYRFSHPSDEGYELSADTLDDAQTQIDEIFEETFGEVLSDEKATGWLKNHGYDPYVGIGPRPKTPYYEFTEDGAIKAYTPYGGNKSGVEVKTFRNPTRKQLRDWMGYKSGGRVERNPYNHEPKAI